MSEYIIRETGYPGVVKQEVVGELVRCKECKWWKSIEGVKPLKFCTYVYGAEFARKEWDYCSRGERKDDGNP